MTMKFALLTSALALTIGSSALAADMRYPARAPAYRAPPPAPYAASWTGCYLGISGGGSWGRAHSVSNGTINGVPSGTAGLLKTDTDLSGGLVGGTIGCNYDFGGFVLGIEADDSWSGKKGDSRLVAPVFNTNFQENVDERWLATLRGRLGYAFGPALLYATGGGAWAGVRIHEFNTLNLARTATEDHTLSGWTVGGGVEWGFSPGWSAKIEYLHVDLHGSNTFFATTATGCCTSQNTELRNDIVRAGINFRFGGAGGPVYARY